MTRSANVLVAGLGSPHGDDQAGWLVIENLALRCGDCEGVVIRRASIPLDVLDWLEGVDVLHICDACRRTNGEENLHRFTWESLRFLSSAEQGRSVSEREVPSPGRGSHSFSLPDVLRLADTMLQLPKRVIIWAIEGTGFQPEDGMSDETRAAALRTVDEIMAELELPVTMAESSPPVSILRNPECRNEN